MKHRRHVEVGVPALERLGALVLDHLDLGQTAPGVLVPLPVTRFRPLLLHL